MWVIGMEICGSSTWYSGGCLGFMGLGCVKFVGLGFVDLVWWVGSFGCCIGGFNVINDGCYGVRSQITYWALGLVRGGKKSKDEKAVQNGLS